MVIAAPATVGSLVCDQIMCCQVQRRLGRSRPEEAQNEHGSVVAGDGLLPGQETACACDAPVKLRAEARPSEQLYDANRICHAADHTVRDRSACLKLIE